MEDAKKKWKNLFDSYKKCLDRGRDPCKSGSGSVKMPTCRIYNELSSIRDTISNRVTSSNLNNSQQASSQSQSPMSLALISISLTPSPVNTAIQNNGGSKNLYIGTAGKSSYP